MNTEARRTLYGGGAIGLALYGLGVATEPILAVTGLAFIWSTLVVSGLFNQLSRV